MNSENNRMIAVCDILGFKDLVYKRGLSDLVKKDLSQFQRLVSFCVRQGEMPEIPPGIVDICEQNRVGFAWFSDTVLIYAQNDEDQSCRNVLETVGWLLFTTMSSSTRIRSGIAYGEFYANSVDGIYVGPGLVEAYLLEQAQEWSGAALTVGASSRIPERQTTGERFQWWVCEYPIPLKEKANVHCSNLVVDWTQAIHGIFDLKWSKQSDEPTEEDIRTNRSVCQKWLNTVKFHKEVCTACFPGNRTRDPLKVM